MTNTDTIQLTTRQWEMLMFLQKIHDGAWVGSLNKRVCDSLVKKRLATIDKNYNVHLTKAGKEWENPKSIQL